MRPHYPLRLCRHQKLGFFFLLLSLCILEINCSPLEAMEIEAITKPSADIEVSFVQSGKIKTILVKEGQIVTKGDLLASQEDEIELIQLEILTNKVKNTTPIELAELELIQKLNDLEKMKAARKDGAITEWEFQHSELEANTARLSFKLAEFENYQDTLQQKTIIEIIDRLHLFSPIDGIIEEIKAEAGESLQALKPIIRLVNTDIIQINAPVPLVETDGLAVGQKAIITYPDGPKVEGVIDTISSVADAAADTLEVKILAINELKRPAGERVIINFTAISSSSTPVN